MENVGRKSSLRDMTEPKNLTRPKKKVRFADEVDAASNGTKMNNAVDVVEKAVETKSEPKEDEKKTGETENRVSRSDRAGLEFPVSQVRQQLKRNFAALRISRGASVYLAAALEHVMRKLLITSGLAAAVRRRGSERQRITPNCIKMARRLDPEFSLLFRNVPSPEGGVVPHIEKALLTKPTAKQWRTKKRADLRRERERANEGSREEVASTSAANHSSGNVNSDSDSTTACATSTFSTTSVSGFGGARLHDVKVKGIRSEDGKIFRSGRHDNSSVAAKEDHS